MLTDNASRVARRAAVVGCAVMLIGGCQFRGLNSLAMPGTAGHGNGSFRITAELPDVTTLPQNSPVMVDDVTVGSVSGVQAVERPDGTFYAALKLSLKPNVSLPANAVVKIAQTSLLGSQHIVLAAPEDRPATGKLRDGATIPLNRASAYPTTEEVLSSLGVVVNKGNLGALQDITDELYNGVAGRAGEFANFVPRLAELAESIDQETGDIVAAIDKLNRFASVVARGNDKMSGALNALPGALRVLNQNGDNIVAAFSALRRFATVTAHILAETKSDFAADLKDAYPVVKSIAENANALIDALPIIPTFPFPSSGFKQAVRGDYLNVIATFDITIRRLGETIFTTSPLDPNMKHMGEILNPPDFLVGEMANLSGQAADPFKIPPKQESGSH
ncbi:MCE family protein [Mycobacterium sp. E2479]|uniref:MCE family protein n=1 Tax=Mycobacterium sp. E2479 TaxID=1834134 RepID=UPI0007FD4AD6|nr:MCE family protein [Mycobacterium sp. E2479]OBH49264.1 mammalian cell entry protein [Mycobacterium sp. E2479]